MLTGRVKRHLAEHAFAVVATSLTTAVAGLVNHYVSIPNISLLYLPVILVTAVYFGTWPSLAAATLAVLEYDFFLLRPLFTFSIDQAQDVLAFVIFVVVAVLTSQLAAGARARAEAAQRRAAENATLYELGQALMSASDMDDVLHAITRRIVDVFAVDHCAIFVPRPDGQLQLAAETVRTARDRGRASQAAAIYAFRQGAQVGLPTGGALVTGQQRSYVPLRTADRIVGVMEVGVKRSGQALDTEEQRLVTSFAAQAALVIARAQSEEERHKLEVLEESDRLKSALLSAVSHDLRTPLASIKASATALLLSGVAWTPEEGREFVETIDHEADRLNRLVGNLLDLSRIEAGVLRPVLDWYTPDELIDGVVPHLRPLLGARPFTVDVQSHISAVHLDLLRIESLLINLVDNAVKYTPPGTPVALRIWGDDDGLHLAVVDQGPGIPERQRDQIFDRFYRMRQHSDRDPGTGLGLAICRGIAEAHGGAIQVTETPGGGATFVVTLPPSCVDAGVPV